MTGIYKIKNDINGKCYIGSSVDIKKRFYQHISALKKGKHFNGILQKSWDKNGGDSFSFEIIELCEREQLLRREKYWLDRYKSYDRNFGYNIHIEPNSNLGLKFSDDHRRKISESRRGPKNVLYGKKLSEEHKNRISAALKGRTFTPEHLKKNSESQKGEKNHMFGKHLSDETKKKLSSSIKGLFKGTAHYGYVDVNEEVSKEIIKLRDRGCTYDQIMRETTIGVWVIRRILKGHLKPSRIPWNKGLKTTTSGTER